MNEEKKTEVRCSHSEHFWLAGFLFTLGFTGVWPAIFSQGAGELLKTVFVTYLLWPVLLGQFLANLR